MKLPHLMSDCLHHTLDGKIRPYHFPTQRRTQYVPSTLLTASTVFPKNFLKNQLQCSPLNGTPWGLDKTVQFPGVSEPPFGQIPKATSIPIARNSNSELLFFIEKITCMRTETANFVEDDFNLCTGAYSGEG